MRLPGLRPREEQACAVFRLRAGRTATALLPDARTEAQREPKSDELLTLLLTPGDFGADKPSQDRGLQANDRKSSKQSVDGSNPSGGVSIRAYFLGPKAFLALAFALTAFACF